MLEVSEGTDSSVLPVNLAIVVDVSESMHIRLATEAQFTELARTGVMQEVLVDGVPAWQSEDIPAEVLNSLPGRRQQQEFDPCLRFSPAITTTSRLR